MTPRVLTEPSSSELGSSSTNSDVDEPSEPLQETVVTRRRSSFLIWDKNPNLSSMPSDYLYHIDLSKEQASHFADVKFVCVGGSSGRMTSFAYRIADALGFSHDQVESVGKHERYVVFKVGPVLIASHGMGGPSMSILLNEFGKLLKYAHADAVWIRIGTCGGVGLAPGTVAISEQSLNGGLEPYHQTYVLGKSVRRPAKFDDELCLDLKKQAEELGFTAVICKTMCCDDFYEGQGRLDGAICEYDMDEKVAFLQRAYDLGVRNIEMESLQFGAFCQHMGLSATTIASVFLDRMEDDQLLSTPEQLKEFEDRSVKTAISYVKHVIQTNAWM